MKATIQLEKKGGKPLKVRFQKTVLVKEPYTIFKTIVSDVQEVLFNEIVKDLNVTTGNLSDDYGHVSSVLMLSELKKQVENRNVVYIVEAQEGFLRFSPQVKSQTELQSFQNAVVSCGALD